MNCKLKKLLILLCLAPMWGFAQVGEHRNQFTVGIHGGCNLNTIDFMQAKVNQKMHLGMMGGLMARYTCEKYFKTICSIQIELNYSQLGWDEDIVDREKAPIPTTSGNDSERYKRTFDYFQVPITAHLAWGKEKQGVNFFFEAGPLVGFTTNNNPEPDTNFSPETVNYSARGLDQEYLKELYINLGKKIDNSFDYGIAAGIGAEVHIKNIGRLQLSGRYYYGLGNIFYDSKRDYFSRSAHQTITIHAAYLVDL